MGWFWVIRKRVELKLCLMIVILGNGRYKVFYLLRWGRLCKELFWGYVLF